MSNFSRGGGGGGQSISIQITCDFPGGGFGPPIPSGSSHENSLFRCFAHGLMLPEFGPESGALATVGEFVLCVTMT